MNIFKHWLQSLRGKTIVNPQATQEFFLAPRFRDSQSELTEPFLQHSYVYAAISSIAEAAASVPFSIMESTRQENSKVERIRKSLIASRNFLRPKNKIENRPNEAEEVSSGEFYELFRSPNPTLSPSQLWQATSLFFKIRGEAIWILEGKTDARLAQGETPSEIWPCDPKKVKHVVDKETGLISLWKLEYSDAQGIVRTISYEPHEIIHFRHYNPYDKYRGLSPIRAAMLGISQDYKAAQYNEAFFDAGASPGGLLSTESQLTKEQADQIRYLWEDRHAGPGKRFRIAVLHSGMKFDPISESHKDMEFLEQRRWSREEILAVLKVPKMIVGLYEDINYATSQTAQRIFWENAVIPMLRNFEDTLIARIFAPLANENQFGVFDLSNVEALRDDLTSKSEIASRFFALGYPINTINERLELGFPPVEGGDVGYIPMGLQPLDLALDPSFLEDEEEPDTSSNEQEQQVAAVKKSTQRWEKKFDAFLKQGETAMRQKFRGYLMRLRKETLRRLEEADRSSGIFVQNSQQKVLTPTAIQAIIFAREKWDNELRETLKPVYQSVMKAAWKDAAGDLGVNVQFNLQDPRVVELMANKLSTLVRVNRTIQKGLQELLTVAISKGETVSEISAKIRSKFNQFSAGRATTIARTETGIAASNARAALYEKEGVQYVQWLTANDEFVRKSHADQDEMIIKTGMRFPNGLKFPLEFGGAPEEVINCRCVIVAAEGPG